MKNIFYILVLLSFLACNNIPKENAKTLTPISIKGIQNNATAAESVPILIFNPPHGKPGHNCAIAEGAPLNNVAKPNAQTVPAKNQITKTVATNTVVQPAVNINQKKSRLNPAHGEAGHRCDIAVGAPLNSKPIEITKPIITPIAETKALETKSGLKTNPAHGETGHRCDIAVGAPLT